MIAEPRRRRRLGRLLVSPMRLLGWRLTLALAVCVMAILGGGFLWLRSSSLVAIRQVRVTGLSGPNVAQITRTLKSRCEDDDDARPRRLRVAAHRSPRIPTCTRSASAPTFRTASQSTCSSRFRWPPSRSAGAPWSSTAAARWYPAASGIPADCRRSRSARLAAAEARAPLDSDADRDHGPRAGRGAAGARRCAVPLPPVHQKRHDDLRTWGGSSTSGWPAALLRPTRSRGRQVEFRACAASRARIGSGRGGAVHRPQRPTEPVGWSKPAHARLTITLRLRVMAPKRRPSGNLREFRDLQTLLRNASRR